MIIHNLNEATKKDFFDLSRQQRDRPEKAMLQVQHAMVGGVISYAVEHIGDLIHRMSEQATFSSAGYEYVKEKVTKMLNLLNNPYGFLKEFEENIVNNADYTKTPVNQYKEKVLKSLENYVREHEKLPTYNQAQYFAKLAAISIGQLKINMSIVALKVLERHLENEDEWIRFAHEELD